MSNLESLISTLNDQLGFFKNGETIVHNGILRKLAKYIDRDGLNKGLSFPKDYKEFLEKTNGGELKFLSVIDDDIIQYTVFESIDDIRFNYQLCSVENVSYLDFLTEDDYRTLAICVNSKLPNFGYVYGIDSENNLIKHLTCSFTDLLNMLIKNIEAIKTSNEGLVSSLMNLI